MAAIGVMGQICDGPIAKKFSLEHVLTIHQISCFYHRMSNCFIYCTNQPDYMSRNVNYLSYMDGNCMFRKIAFRAINIIIIIT